MKSVKPGYVDFRGDIEPRSLQDQAGRYLQSDFVSTVSRQWVKNVHPVPNAPRREDLKAPLAVSYVLTSRVPWRVPASLSKRNSQPVDVIDYERVIGSCPSSGTSLTHAVEILARCERCLCGLSSSLLIRDPWRGVSSASPWIHQGRAQESALEDSVIADTDTPPPDLGDTAITWACPTIPRITVRPVIIRRSSTQWLPHLKEGSVLVQRTVGIPPVGRL